MKKLVSIFVLLFAASFSLFAYSPEIQKVLDSFDRYEIAVTTDSYGGKLDPPVFVCWDLNNRIYVVGPWGKSCSVSSTICKACGEHFITKFIWQGQLVKFNFVCKVTGTKEHGEQPVGHTYLGDESSFSEFKQTITKEFPDIKLKNIDSSPPSHNSRGNPLLRRTSRDDLIPFANSPYAKTE